MRFKFPRLTHSMIVSALKVATAGGSALLIGLIFVWPELRERDEGISLATEMEEAAGSSDSLLVTKPVFRMFDSEGQSFFVRSNKAKEVTAGSKIVALEYPYGDIALKKSVRVYVSARQGMLNQDKQTLALTDSIRVETSDGHKMRTQIAVVNFPDKTVEGDSAVAGSSPLGNMEGEGFRVLDRGDTVSLTGRSRAEISKVKGGAARNYGFGFEKNNAPLIVTSDGGIEWKRLADTVSAARNAVATKGGASLRAERLTAKYDSSGQVTDISAVRNVIVRSWENAAFGDSMEYDIGRDLIKLLGSPARINTATDSVSARSFEYMPNRMRAQAVGRAAITRSDGRTITADRITATFSDDRGGVDIVSAVAEGSVAVGNGAEIAYGDRATYDARTGKARLTGSVRLARGESELAGDQLDINLDTGVSSLKSGGRVTGSFVP